MQATEVTTGARQRNYNRILRNSGFGNDDFNVMTDNRFRADKAVVVKNSLTVVLASLEGDAEQVAVITLGLRNGVVPKNRIAEEVARARQEINLRHDERHKVVKGPTTPRIDRLTQSLGLSGGTIAQPKVTG